MLSFSAEPGASPDEFRLVAREDDQPVGVALITLNRASGTAKLGSLVIDAAKRGRGLAQHLLRSVEATLRQAGVREVETWYEASAPHVAEIEHLLNKMKWGPHQPDMLLARGSKRIAHAPFMSLPTPVGDEVFPWTELTPEEAQALRSASWYPEDLGPFPDEPVEPLNSLGLRVKGAVVGWMLNHRLDHETIRYTRLFVHPDHRIKARGMILVARSVAINVASSVPFGYFGVKADNLPMRRLLERRIGPYLDSLIESRSRKLVL